MKQEAPHTYEFGPFRLTPAEGQLRRNGEIVTLTPKAFEALVLLVERHGRLIEKDDLLKSLWPDTFVEEANLAHHVWRLRKALEDTKGSERYIETVPKRGYRFIAPVTVVEDPAADAVAADSFTPALEENPTHVAATYHGINLKGLVGVCLALVLGFLAFYGFGSRSRPISTLAVLPFKPINSNVSDDAALKLGMTDALITRLSNLTRLTVRPTAAVAKYASSDEPARAGRELQVESVLDGRIQRDGDRIRVTVQLIRTEDGKPLWAEAFDEDFTNIFALQDSISRKVADALALRLSGAESSRIVRHHTDNVEAYQLYLKGRYQMNLSAEGWLKAVVSFQEAIDKDPRYALAYAGLADAHSALGFSGLGSKTPGEEFMKAKVAASKALEIDNLLADAYVSLANITFGYDWNWPEAEKQFKRAIELNPNLAEAHHWYSEYLQAMERMDEALREIKRAQELDPLSLNINFHYGLCLFAMKRYDEALAQYRKTLDIDSSTGASGSHWGIAQIYQQKGQYAEAIHELEEARRLDPRPSFRLTNLAHAYALAGNRKEALAILGQVIELQKSEFISPFSIAQIYEALGDKDEAFVWLERSIEIRETLMAYLRVAPLGRLRSDPRFEQLLQRVGL